MDEKPLAEDRPQLQVNKATERYLDIRRVTVVGGIVDFILGVVKILIGKLAYSQALVADGVHSLSDLATDVMVVWAAKHASRGPDEQHPYGHQRIETVATIVLGLALASVAIGIGYEALEGIWQHKALSAPGVLALIAAALSVLAKEWIYHYTIRVADRLQSDMLRSNAWHSRTDAISSVLVIIGVAGTMMGWIYFDAIAAVAVALMILYVAGQMVRKGIRELIDTGVDPERLAAMKNVIIETEGVVDAHDVRTRLMGSDIYLDGHVLVQPKLSVSEGHRIGEAVKQRLQREFNGIADITIHIDSEDDASYQLSDKLPLRGELKQRILDQLDGMPEARDMTRVTLHYLNGQVHAEVWLALSTLESIEQAEQAAAKIKHALRGQKDFKHIDVVFN